MADPNEADGGNPVEYGMASAVINAQFQEIAHPKREPILGFGGAFTEATALNFMTLDSSGRNAVLDLLFGETGLGYSVGRVHMNSCDFSPGSYDFDNVTDDFELDHFDMTVEHDVMTGMVELMVRADDKLQVGWKGDKLNIMASPWSPPAWMKKPTWWELKHNPGAVHSSGMTGSAEPNCLREGTGPDSRYAAAWALYFSKFVNAYKAWGIDLYAVTVQNEPEFPAPWEACAYNSTNEGEFIANHLGPTLKRDHPDLKLLMFDHNKDHAPQWGADILDESNPAAKYVDGTAIHWYAGGMDRLLDGAVGMANMHRYTDLLKQLKVKDDHIFLGSEACHCPSTGYAGGDLSVGWYRAERYAHTILSDLAAGSNGWVEWNLLLDSIGGPNHLGNLCDAPLLAVPHRANGKHDVVDQLPDFEKTGLKYGGVIGDRRTREELHAIGNPAEYLDRGVVVQPMYYYMGHISRHVRPGSRAVRALVDQPESSPGSRTFHDKKGPITIIGGGVNNLARNGVEVTLWPCEGSTRQEWKLNKDRQFEVYGHDWLGNPTKSCLGKEPDEAFEGLLLSDCTNPNVTATFTQIVVDEALNNSKFVVDNSEVAEEGENCLVIYPLKNNGGAYGPRGGAQVSIGKCDDPKAVWRFDEKLGEVVSSYFGDVGGDSCLTTGWPFLQVNAFVDKTGTNKTMIVLNEAADPANYILRGDEGEIILTNSIPAHSIQTVKF